MTQNTTLEFHGEGKSDLKMASLGVNVVPFSLAEVSLTGGVSLAVPMPFTDRKLGLSMIHSQRANVAGTGGGGNNAFTVYGRIHAGQSPKAGIYTDNVIVTITY